MCPYILERNEWISMKFHITGTEHNYMAQNDTMIREQRIIKDFLVSICSLHGGIGRSSKNMPAQPVSV
jgi:hypothetical protein